MKELKLNLEQAKLILELCDIGECSPEAFKDHKFRTDIGYLRLKIMLEMDL